MNFKSLWVAFIILSSVFISRPSLSIGMGTNANHNEIVGQFKGWEIINQPECMCPLKDIEAHRVCECAKLPHYFVLTFADKINNSTFEILVKGSRPYVDNELKKLNVDSLYQVQYETTPIGKKLVDLSENENLSKHIHLQKE